VSLVPGALLLFGGVAALLLGAALAWGVRPMVGFTIGSAGTIALVVGAILARRAMVGRFMEESP
jgi:hypothetical protein